MKYRVTNWRDYNRGIVQRGDIRFWVDEEAIAAWIAPYRTTPGGQRKFSNFAIETTLMLGAVFGLPLRQTEGVCAQPDGPDGQGSARAGPHDIGPKTSHR